MQVLKRENKMKKMWTFQFCHTSLVSWQKKCLRKINILRTEAVYCTGTLTRYSWIYYMVCWIL